MFPRRVHQLGVRLRWPFQVFDEHSWIFCKMCVNFFLSTKRTSSHGGLWTTRRSAARHENRGRARCQKPATLPVTRRNSGTSQGGSWTTRRSVARHENLGRAWCQKPATLPVMRRNSGNVRSVGSIVYLFVSGFPLGGLTAIHSVRHIFQNTMELGPIDKLSGNFTLDACRRNVQFEERLKV